MMVLRVIMKAILKLYFRLIISSLMIILEKFWKACNKIYIRVETRFVLYIQDTKYLVRVLCIAGFIKGKREINKFIQDRKYIASWLSISISETNYELVKVLPQMSGLRVWCSSGNFAHETNLKVVFSTITNHIRYQGKVNFFIREFWKSFSDFINDFIIVAESFYKNFLRSFSCKRFQSLGIEPTVI